MVADSGIDKQIIIVEDDPDDVFFIVRALTKNNFHNVKVFHDGAEALTYIHESISSQLSLVAHSIILDLRMPRMDGLEFLEALRAEQETSKVTVIVVSASWRESEVETCRRLGVKACLVKPLESGVVARVLNHLADNA